MTWVTREVIIYHYLIGEVNHLPYRWELMYYSKGFGVTRLLGAYTQLTPPLIPIQGVVQGGIRGVSVHDIFKS